LTTDGDHLFEFLQIGKRERIGQIIKISQGEPYEVRLKSKEDLLNLVRGIVRKTEIQYFYPMSSLF
jgi:hypothetical protein